MSTNEVGHKLRELRIAAGLTLRKVSALAEMDMAILSKMERGERKLNRKIIEKLSGIYSHDPHELLIMFLSEKILYEVKDEENVVAALRMAEEHILYRSVKKPNHSAILRSLQKVLKQFSGIEKAWLFGSFARKDERFDSDLDIALQTGQEFSYFDLAEFQYQAEKALNRKVDAGFIDSFKPGILRTVQPDLQLIYEKR